MKPRMATIGISAIGSYRDRSVSSLLCRLFFLAVVTLSSMGTRCGPIGPPTSSSSSPLTVSVAPTTASVTVNSSKDFVANEPGRTGFTVTWALTQSGNPCSPQCGTLVNVTAEAVTYQAPSAVPSTNIVTLTASASGGISASATITITSPTITVAPSSASVGVTNTHVFNATLSGTTAGVNWILTFALGGPSCSPGCGTLDSSTANPVTYTAPAVVPSPSTVLISASSQAIPTLSASATITVNGTPPPLTIRTPPANLTVTVGQPATFSVVASGGTPPYSYQWERDNGTGFANISGANSTTYSIPATVAGDNGAQFRVVVTDAATNSVTSGVATLVVNPVNVPKIAFHSNRKLDGTDNANSTFNIWLMNADGSNSIPLTALVNAISVSPVWSPDGTKILFASSRKLDGTDNLNTNAKTNIWVMNADGSNLIALTTLTTADSSSPAWSPDGTKIAYVSSRALDGTDNPNQDTNIWIMDSDGFNQGALTHYTFSGATHGIIDAPVWSPVQVGGQYRIAFGSRANLNGTDSAGAFVSNIWRINPDGIGLTPLTTLTNVNCFSPQWSPDATKIAFGSPRALDGTDAINNNGNSGTNPNGTSNIWVMNADGTGQTALTQLMATGAGSLGPVWSPDGSRILFTSSRTVFGNGADSANANNVQNIWVMNANGTSPIPLTAYTIPAGFITAAASGAAWSPVPIGGQFQIAFVTYGKLDGSDNPGPNSAFNIWLMNADGSLRPPLTSLTVASTSGSPAWQP